MKSRFVALIAAGMIAACYSKPAEKGAAGACLHAVVWDTSDLDCGMPVLSFQEDPTVIRTITGREDLMYVAKDLPQALNKKNSKLCVTVARLQPDEDFNCTMMGISYPHIKIVNAKKRE